MMVRLNPSAENTPLLHVEVVKTLLDLGVNVNTSKADKWSTFERAVVNNASHLVGLFLKRGSDVNFFDRGGYAPLPLPLSSTIPMYSISARLRRPHRRAQRAG